MRNGAGDGFAEWWDAIGRLMAIADQPVKNIAEIAWREARCVEQRERHSKSRS